jgi:hypothetical protein
MLALLPDKPEVTAYTPGWAGQFEYIENRQSHQPNSIMLTQLPDKPEVTAHAPTSR